MDSHKTLRDLLARLDASEPQSLQYGLARYDLMSMETVEALRALLAERDLFKAELEVMARRVVREQRRIPNFPNPNTGD
jgi:hypothetical protein